MVPDHSRWGGGIISDDFAVERGYYIRSFAVERVVGTGHALSSPAPSTMSQGNGVVIYGHYIRRFTVGWGHSIRRFSVGQDRACPVPTVRGLLWCAYRCTGYGWTSGVGLRVLAPGCWLRFKPLDAFVMPNHVHGILLIDKPMDAPPDATPSPIVETIDWLRRVREVGKRLFGYAGMVENKTLPLYLLVSLFL
ncbi:MAG: hypothetical protein RL181_1035 [Bacteroidota bacterium]